MMTDDPRDVLMLGRTIKTTGITVLLTDNQLWGIVVPLIANVQPKYEGWS